MRTKAPINVNLKVKHFREAKGLSQAELARRIGVTREIVSSYEKGKYVGMFQFTLKLCELLDCEITDLVKSKYTTYPTLGSDLELWYNALPRSEQDTFASSLGIKQSTLETYFKGLSNGLEKVLRVYMVCRVLDCKIRSLVETIK